MKFKTLLKKSLILLGLVLGLFILLYFIPLKPSSEFIKQAKETRKEYSSSFKNDSLIVLVDYSYPVFMKRFWVYNIENDEIALNTHVSHSWKSGLVFADEFSNEPGSNLSSIGVIKISERYHGKYGPSLRLDGLEKENNKIRERAIVMHPLVDFRLYGITIPSELAFYSFGCFALDIEDLENIRNWCHDGTLMLVVD